MIFVSLAGNSAVASSALMITGVRRSWKLAASRKTATAADMCLMSTFRSASLALCPVAVASQAPAPIPHQIQEHHTLFASSTPKVSQYTWCLLII
eukprot:5546814-Amphidinium_carterae.1